MKLKDYEIPQYGLNDGFEDLSQYSLKNFDLEAYQRAQQQPDPEPVPAPSEPYLFQQETDSTRSLPAALEAPSPHPLHSTEPPTEPSFEPAAMPAQTEWSQPAVDPADVHFGLHFNLQTVSYTPLSPAQSWKIPRWVVTMVGLFFGSAVVMTIVTCVVLLRDPKPAPTEQVAAPTASVAPTSTAPSDVARAASAPVPETTTKAPVAAAVRHPAAAAANLLHADPARSRRIVVSRHPGVVRRHVLAARRVASKSASSSMEAQETETASRRPPPDDLDKLLSESSL